MLRQFPDAEEKLSSTIFTYELNLHVKKIFDFFISDAELKEDKCNFDYRDIKFDRRTKLNIA